MVNSRSYLESNHNPHEYGKVILPMTVIKRFNDTLQPTHKVRAQLTQKVKHLEVIDGFLQRASGYQFYNISQYDFKV
ncbi:MAG: type I restriction-modification system subunit M N-terminal domain-containing protein [Intestinibacter bartlettii]